VLVDLYVTKLKPLSLMLPINYLVELPQYKYLSLIPLLVKKLLMSIKLKMKLKLNSLFTLLQLIMMMPSKLIKSSIGAIKKLPSGLTKFSISLNSKLKLNLNHSLPYISVIFLNPMLHSKLLTVSLKLLMKLTSLTLTNLL